MEMKKYKLGDIGEVRMCKRILKEETNTVSGVPFFKIGTFGNVADVFITREKFEEYKAKYSYPKKGDVLISAAGTIGRTVVYNGEDAYYQDSNIVWIENDESKVVNSLLYYAYKNVKWKVSNGSTILRLYNDDLRRTEIFVPADISVQKKIASILSTLDKRIENLRAQNRVLEQTAKTIYDYTFLQCAGYQTTYNKTLNRNIPTNWEVKKLSDVADILSGGTPKTARQDFWNGDIPWLSVKDFNIESTYVLKSERNITKLGLDNCAATLLEENDIVMSARGTVGVMTMVPYAMTFNQSCFGFHAKDIPGNSPYFLYYTLKTTVNELVAGSHGSVFNTISRDDLGRVNVAFPDSQSLDKFNAQVEPIFKKQLVNTKQIETLTTQRNTLLPLLMTGQVMVL